MVDDLPGYSVPCCSLYQQALVHEILYSAIQIPIHMIIPSHGAVLNALDVG
ncbi:hypothetical protein [Pseudomonas sp. COR18]|uniref:hypothetical protein n=1 Tax=Pseudomonas sp. COR18 TaxID=3399680 RepID=UPI003B00447D